MSRKFIASLTGCLLLGVFVCMPAMGDDDDSKPKITIKDVMKKGFNKRKGLLPKVTKGSATDEEKKQLHEMFVALSKNCLLYTSPSPRDQRGSRMPSSA